MFTHNTKYRDVVIAFPFGQRTSFLSNAKNLAKYVEQSQREILHCVQDDRNLWVNCYIISFFYYNIKIVAAMCEAPSPWERGGVRPPYSQIFS